MQSELDNSSQKSILRCTVRVSVSIGQHEDCLFFPTFLCMVNLDWSRLVGAKKEDGLIDLLLVRFGFYGLANSISVQTWNRKYKMERIYSILIFGKNCISIKVGLKQ